MEHDTDYGKVSTDELLRVFHMWKKMIAKGNERKCEFNQSEQGKEKNRANAKKYYEKHKEEILAKRKVYYDSKRNPENH